MAAKAVAWLLFGEIVFSLCMAAARTDQRWTWGGLALVGIAAAAVLIQDPTKEDDDDGRRER